jgi:penicillin-binding protein A
VRGATGLERAYNEELSGRTARQQVRSFGDLFTDTDRTGNLTLTVRSDVQEAAAALGEQRGSVVALDPRTGGVLGLWSYPTFDPNMLSSHDFEATEAAYALLEAAPGKPLLPKAYQEIYPPGSTFKVVTGAAGVEDGIGHPHRARVPLHPGARRAWDHPRPAQLRRVALRRGAVRDPGAKLQHVVRPDGARPRSRHDDRRSEAFGFNGRPPFDLPTATSRFPTDFTRDQPKLAQSSIGQNDVAATPLQMALVAAGIANDGVIMAPRVVAQIRDGEGALVQPRRPHPVASGRLAPDRRHHAPGHARGGVHR